MAHGRMLQKKTKELINSTQFYFGAIKDSRRYLSLNVKAKLALVWIVNMERFRQLFRYPFCNVIGMIHLRALPGKLFFCLSFKLHFNNHFYILSGTPKSSLSIEALSEIACQEAEVYRRYNLVSTFISKFYNYFNTNYFNPKIRMEL